MRPITENGLPRAIIVLPEGAQPVEEHAARELRRYIGELSQLCKPRFEWRNTKFGIEIPLTPWQEQNLSMMRRLFAHACMCGIRLFHEVTWHQPWLSAEPGSMPYYDGEQTAKFRRQYAQQTGEQIPTVPYEWCDLTFEWMDPRMPVVKRYISACVQTQAEELGAEDG